MALIGLSLVLASVVYIAVRRPPFVETLLALWRRHPRIEKPPNGTRSGEDGSITITTEDASSSPDAATSTASATRAAAAAANRAAMPPPPVIRQPNGSADEDDAGAPSPQTTPKATATHVNVSVPTFSLSSSPPASAAAVARTTDSTASSSSALAASSTSTLPTLAAVPSAPSKPTPATTSMAPPPRPPTLNNINHSSLITPAPSRPSPLPSRQQQPQEQQRARQPGTSTLAPPPSHSSKPAKPSRKVTLEPGHSPLDWARLANHPASDLRGLGPGTPYLRVTPSMLKRQTGRKGKDAWTALGGRVYNMTPYLPFHPGGEPELLRAAGRDGTKLFGEIHPWVNYETMLGSCLIGLLVEEGEARSSGAMDAMD